MKNIDNRYISSTIVKALDVLKLFNENNHLSFTEILNKLEYNKSTLYRILYTLEVNNFLKKNEYDRYSLGVDLFILGNSISKINQIKEVSSPYMRKLTAEVNLPTQLGVFERRSVVIIHKEDPPNSIKTFSRIGKEVPAHSTGQGKALLSFSTQQKVEEIIESKGLQKFTDTTITSKEGLWNELKLTKERGYSIDNTETEENIKCVAAPILNRNDTAEAAISITGTTLDYKNSRIVEKYANKVKTISEKIQEKLGYNF